MWDITVILSQMGDGKLWEKGGESGDYVLKSFRVKSILVFDNFSIVF